MSLKRARDSDDGPRKRRKFDNSLNFEQRDMLARLSISADDHNVDAKLFRSIIAGAGFDIPRRNLNDLKQRIRRDSTAYTPDNEERSQARPI